MVCFLTNLKLFFLNNQQVAINKKHMEDLVEYSPLTVDELDDAAFLSLHDLKTPKYHDAIEHYMQEAMEEDENSHMIPTQDALQSFSGPQHGAQYTYSGQADNYGYSALPHETGNSKARNVFFRSTLEPEHRMAAGRDSLGDPFTGEYTSQRATNYPLGMDGIRESLPPDLGGSYQPQTSSSRFRSGNASSKLEELNQSYQKYINYLQYQNMVKNYYAGGRQPQNGMVNDDQLEDDVEGSEEAMELETDQEVIISMHPSEYYKNLLGLEMSNTVYNGKPDFLISKIVTLQSFFRGWITRKRLLLKSIFDRAATLIQAGYRGHRIRRRIQPALRQLRKTIKEELKRIEIEAALKVQEQNAGTDKNEKKAEVVQSTLAPLELKMMELEEENKKMRDKLDKQSELMLNLLASQNMSQLNTSNKLLTELKEEITELKEESRHKYPETIVDKTDIKNTMDQQAHIDQQTESRAHKIDHGNLHANRTDQGQTFELTKKREEQGKAQDDQITEKSFKIERREDGQLDTGDAVVDVNTGIEESKVIEEESDPAKDPGDAVISDEEQIQIAGETKKIPIGDESADNVNQVEEPDDPNAPQKEDSKVIVKSVSKTEQDKPSVPQPPTLEANTEIRESKKNELQVNKRCDPEPRSQPYKHQNTSQPAERHLSSRRTASDLDKRLPAEEDGLKSPSLVAASTLQNQSFAFELPFDIHMQLPPDDYEPPEDEFAAHIMDGKDDKAVSEVVEKDELPIVPEESPKKSGKKSTTGTKAGYGYGGRSSTSRGSNNARGYGGSSGGNFGALNKSATSSRIGSATKGKAPTGMSQNRPGTAGGGYGVSPKSTTPINNKLGSPGMGSSSLKKNVTTTSNINAGYGVGSTSANTLGKPASTAKPQTSSGVGDSSAIKKPLPAPKKAPTPSVGGQSIRSMMSSMGKGSSSTLYGRR